MYPYIHIVLPAYGTLAVLGGILVMFFLYFRIEKYNIPFSVFLKTFGICLVYGAVGSRLLFVLTRIPWLVSHFSLKAVLSTVLGGGFVYYGGLFGVLFGLLRASKKYGLDTKSLFNMVTPGIPLFHCLGRIGCFLAGCCYGFPLPAPLSLGGLVIDRFPTQLIESAFNLVLFIVIVLGQRRKDNLHWLRIYLTTYAVFRFLIEFTRGDAIRGVFFGISTSQIISLAIVVYCGYKAFFGKKNATKTVKDETVKDETVKDASLEQCSSNETVNSSPESVSSGTLCP